MTCVVGVAEDGVVTLGGDSIAIEGYRMHTRPTPKVFRHGPLVVGVAGSFRLADVIRFHYRAEPPPERGDLRRWVAVAVVDPLRDLLKAQGVAQVENNVEGVDGSLLVGVRGQLYEIDSDYHVGQPAGGRGAIGCGASVALGALYALRQTGTARRRLTTALEAASTYNAGVRGPFHIVTLRPPGTRHTTERHR